MKNVIVLAAFLSVTGCGGLRTVSFIATPSSCSAETVNGQKEVTCTNGTSFPVNDGTNGQNGYSVGTITEAATLSQCSAGGQVIEFYQDINYNGVYASNDPITSQVIVCNGTNGQNGQNGLNGLNGTNSSVNVTQATQTQCANGGLSITSTNGASSSSSVVCNGATGPQGQEGPQGIQGLAGVSAVQFCPNYTTSYPGTFPEFGLCVGNNLYAVYWDSKNAWLAEVVPGYYASTSTSAPCDFTVTTGCQISH